MSRGQVFVLTRGCVRGQGFLLRWGGSRGQGLYEEAEPVLKAALAGSKVSLGEKVPNPTCYLPTGLRATYLTSLAADYIDGRTATYLPTSLTATYR